MKNRNLLPSLNPDQAKGDDSSNPPSDPVVISSPEPNEPVEWSVKLRAASLPDDPYALERIQQAVLALRAIGFEVRDRRFLVSENHVPRAKVKRLLRRALSLQEQSASATQLRNQLANKRKTTH